MSELIRIDRDLWCAEGDLWMAGQLIHFGVRTTVWREPDGLVLLSPIAPGPWMDEIDALGPVKTIMAPNLMHHLFLRPAKERWPSAELVGPPGLPEKRSNLHFDRVVDGEEREAIGPNSQLFPVRGAPKMNELVVFHRPSSTLIVTDLIFNVQDPQGLLTSVVLSIAGALRRTGQSRVWHLLVKDRTAAKQSVLPLTQLPVQRLVVAHGDVVEDASPELVAQALKWMISAPDPAPART